MTNNFPSFLSGPAEEASYLRRGWACLLAVGIMLILVGVLALVYPIAATITTVELFGLVLVIGGAVEVASGFWAGRWGGFLLHLLCGLLSVFLGVAMIDRPLLGAAGYTLVLAVFFFASGVARVVFALSRRFSGWGWVLLNGAISLLLGVMIWREMPEAALWVIGTFVGIDLIFNGLSWVMVALAVRTVAPPPATSPTAPELARA